MVCEFDKRIVSLVNVCFEFKCRSGEPKVMRADNRGEGIRCTDTRMGRHRLDGFRGNFLHFDWNQGGGGDAADRPTRL